MAGFEERQGSIADCLLRQYLCAAEILASQLGSDWVKRHVFCGGKPDAFLRATATQDLDRYKHQDRVIALADMLFNFQAIPGIEERLVQLRAGDVEGTIAELEGAKLLFRSGVPFQFVAAIGARGSDFDVEALIGSTNTPCEMKSKIEQTELSSSTLKNTLNSSRTQFPKDKPGIVFVKIPEHWAKNPKMQELASAVLTEVFRNTGRIAMVVFHWEEWHTGNSGGAMRLVRFRPEVNEGARSSVAGLADTIRAHNRRPPTSTWRYIRDLVC